MSSDETVEQSGTGIASRTKSRNSFVEWVLVDGDRLLLTACSSAVVLVLLLALDAVGLIAFTNENSLTRMASGMIAGTFSLVTLVVSVNQLILSQDLSPAGQFRDRLEGVLEFRRDVEEATSVPATPAEPTRLLELIAADIRHRATVLADTVGPHENDEYWELVAQYADSVEDSTEQLDETLEEGGVSAFDALSAAVEYDDAWQLYAARHLRNDAPPSAEETTRAFDELIAALRLFSTAEQHFKTVYLQRELTRFSQLTIYSGVPAVVAAVLVSLLYGDVGGATVAHTYLPYVTSILVSIVVFPLLLLASYILRTATLTRRTAAIGPMLPQKDPDAGPFEISYGEGD